ncbi:hypothetical protein HYT26_04100 [Candidatus Pacearchaeota archaeon]|nr:hypothetical protein [Candidatus Pacearchaeota archaeon]
MQNLNALPAEQSSLSCQVVNAKFECPSCGTIISVLQVERTFREPSRCSCGRKGGFKLTSREMVDVQRIVVEESPETLEGGEQPRKISVFLKEDLVDPKMEERTTPGSRVRVIGILKEVPVPTHTGAIQTRFDLMVEVNNVIPLEETFETLEIDEEDERQIKELSEDPKIFEKLAQSISPSVYGYEEIKQSLVLQLFSGVKKKRSDGTDSRGDLHVLLVGDPGVAKSVILKFMASISPKGRYVAGRGTTGAGLTAAVVRDEFLRGWSLEAGAMVLANKGLVCIDEVEKMDEGDRSAMHEALEQQCFHYDTIISLADGSEVKIGEFVESLLEKNKDKLIEGKDCIILPAHDIEVLTTDWKRIFKTKVARVSKHKAFDRFIKIKFGNGREIIVTPEHPVFCAENGEIITKRADSIKIAEDIPIALVMPIEGKEQYLDYNFENKRAIQHIKIPNKNNGELFKIIGYLVAEGSKEINRGKIIGINFANKDKRLLDDFESCMKSVFNLCPYKQARIDEYGARFMYRYISTELARFFLAVFPEVLKRAGEKQIPRILMKGRKQDIAKMLSALFEGDGYVTIKKRTIRIGYGTKSKRLAEQIQDLLLRFGIRSNINTDREFFKVLITSYDNIEKFLNEISFIRAEKNNIIEAYLREKKIKRSVKDIIPDSFNEKIISIIKDEGLKNVGRYKIYDIIYDHLKRKDKFSFSRRFLKSLLELSKNQKNRDFLEKLTTDIGWDKVIGIELIKNESEKWAYDVTIEPSHSFISQGCILHNTVTISKANVQATLRAETSVLAAGNPKLGRFDPFQPIAKQIDVQPTLLNRFDLIFILRDLPDRAKDEAIATHVLMEHQKAEAKNVIEKELFRKYIAYSKQRVQPKLTDEAVDEIKRFYVDLRNAPTSSDDVLKPIPISARQLEAIVRLSEASAKTRLSKKVTRDDVRRAINLTKYYLMQVGYDYETKTFDIDKIVTGISTSQRSKIILVREALARLESRIGKLIPVQEIEKEMEGKLKPEDIQDALGKLNISGDVFIPRKGFVQRI